MSDGVLAPEAGLALRHRQREALPSRNPCPATVGFVRNAWYVVAYSHEVGRAELLCRRCCDEPLVLYRTEHGDAVALYDRCPHRGVPLSHGKIVGNSIQCSYHGFQFASDGRCGVVPTQEQIPRQMCVKTYPLIEKAHFIWIWMGDPAKADESLLPDHYALGLDRPGWTAAPYFMLEIKANYSMLFENLLDTSHISFLHGSALDSGRMAQASFRIEHDERSVRLIRDLKGDMPNPSNAGQYGLQPGVMFDRELTSLAYLPNLHVIRNTFTFPSEPGHAPHIRINVMPITPVSTNRLYQFLTLTTSYPEQHPSSLIEAMRKVFGQDTVALEAIQQYYDDLGEDLPECSVKADGAALMARRNLASMSSAETPSLSRD